MHNASISVDSQSSGRASRLGRQFWRGRPTSQPTGERSGIEVVQAVAKCCIWELARPTGFEPVTSAFGGQHSIQLSYGRVASGRAGDLTRPPARRPQGASGTDIYMSRRPPKEQRSSRGLTLPCGTAASSGPTRRWRRTWPGRSPRARACRRPRCSGGWAAGSTRRRGGPWCPSGWH
jgi:hypothetical protein